MCIQAKLNICKIFVLKTFSPTGYSEARKNVDKQYYVNLMLNKLQALIEN